MDGKTKALWHIRWLVRGEYLIGVNECGREVALIKLYDEELTAGYESGNPLYNNQNGRVIV